MGKTLIELIIVILTCVITNFVAYKLIRKMDKKERVKLHKMETNYYNELKEKHDQLYNTEEITKEEIDDQFYDNLDMLEELTKND